MSFYFLLKNGDKFCQFKSFSVQIKYWKKKKALLILLFWEINPFGGHKNFTNVSNTTRKALKYLVSTSEISFDQSYDRKFAKWKENYKSVEKGSGRGWETIIFDSA